MIETESFIDIQPSEIDRLRWYKQGNRVFCNNCWWVGADNNYDQCPERYNNKLEWISDKAEDD
jgi:hypothetical protein